MTKIITLINKRNAGDDAAAIATAKATQDKIGGDVEQINISEPNQLENLRPENGVIVIGSGSHMLDTMRDLKLKNSTITTCFAAHQIPDNIVDYLPHLDLVAFPQHVLNEENLTTFKNKLIKTIGVAHNLTSEDLAKEFEKRQNEIPAADKYLLVILGGDAQLQGDQYQYYTAQEAAKTAQYAAQQVKDEGYFLLVTNGPRTGMLNPTDGTKLGTHRPVTNPEYKIDPVSQAFLDELTTQKISGDQFKFYDFKFLENGVDSAYKALLHATKQTPKSSVLVPGESTSMISECCDMLPREAVLVVPNNAMNNNHKSHVKSVIDSSYAMSLDVESNEISSNLAAAILQRQPAAATIADEIQKLYHQKSAPGTNPGLATATQPQLNSPTVGNTL